MPTLPSGKYQLKSLHLEIALFDRKVAHARNFEVFADEGRRDAAVAKLNSKRILLVRIAQQMIDEGIEYRQMDRPRSLDPYSVGKQGICSVFCEQTTEQIFATSKPTPSPYAGTVLDYQLSLADYKKRARSRRN
jgi:hypothetical protein